MSYNQLTRKRAFDLYDWMRNNEKTVRSLEDVVVAAKAQHELGFTISPANITSIRSDLGWKKRMKIDAGKTAQALHDRIAAIESALDSFLPEWRDQ